MLVVATIPAAIAGAVGEKRDRDHLGNPWEIAINLAVFGGLL
jgi:undecaprenyl pyrophosphate phosphatase UppP